MKRCKKSSRRSSIASIASTLGCNKTLTGFEDGDSRLANALKCADDFDQDVKASPKIEDLDRAASDYATAIRALAPLGVETDRYYNQNDYKDDKWAKGRELNGKLQPLIEKLEQASDGLHAGVKRELKSIRLRQLPTACRSDWDRHE